MSFSYEPSVVKVHTPLCFVEGFDPIYVTSRSVKDLFKEDSTANTLVKETLIRNLNSSVASNPNSVLSYPVICGQSSILVKKPIGSCSQAFYDTTSLNQTYQVGFGRMVKGPREDSLVPTLIDYVRVRSWSFTVLHKYPKQVVQITEARNYALWARLNNLFSSGSFACAVKSTLKPVTAQPALYIVKSAPLIGRYNDVLLVPSGFADIAATSELHGLRVGHDGRSIGGIVGFSSSRRINITLGDGTKIELYLEPINIERIL